ncbi:MAG: hypothetical protein D6760_04375 [Deltaproteobacteria bacterium]|nr:MAG: hypothetical protein D6760_04375 [Deltaproteobacteria bacterium]
MLECVARVAAGGSAAAMLAFVAPVFAGDLGPTLHLSLDDGAGSSVASDSSGNGLDGSLTNMDVVAAWVPAVSGLGLSCDGIDDFVRVPDDPLLDFGAGDFSVSFWARKRSTSVGTNYKNIYGVDKWNTGQQPGTNEWLLNLGIGNPQEISDRPRFTVESGTRRYRATGPDPLTLDEWHHLVRVRRDDELRLYVDGVLVDTDTSLPCGAAVNDAGRNLNIARNEGGFTRATDGIFDEVQIYRFALRDGGVAVGETAGGEVAMLFSTPAQVVVRSASTTTTTLPPCPIPCGDAVTDGSITATDALFALRAAVRLETCALCVCDANRSGDITATDALVILRGAVGSPELLDCPCRVAG